MYEELINRLRYCAHSACGKCEQIGQCYPGCHEQLQGEAANTIERLQAFNAMWQGAAEMAHENEMKWIPVTERLPEESWERVLAYTDDGTVMTLPAIKLRNGYVRYWMPLPEPPKEE